MEYITRKFQNTVAGIDEKDVCTRQLTAEGYHIVSEQVEQGHVKGAEQCCGALICLPLIFMAGRTPGTILVTYGRELLYCTSCGKAVVAGQRVCPTCNADISKEAVSDPGSARRITQQKQEADQRTAEIKNRIAQMEKVLTDRAASTHKVDWNSFTTPFSLPEPQAPSPRKEALKPTILRISSTIPIIERLVPALRMKRVRWETSNNENRRHSELASAQHSRDVAEWKRKRDLAEHDRTVNIEAKKRLYLAKDVTVLHEYWEKVLLGSRYSLNFPRSFKLGYAADKQRLIVDYTLPPLSSIPQVAAVKYDQSKDTLEDVPVSESGLKDLYRDLVIKIALRTLFELFEADGAEALTSIAFNGRIRGMDVAIGSTTEVFVASIEASKPEMASINLANVDPKACFNRLRGRLSTDLIQREPIEPIRFQPLESVATV